MADTLTKNFKFVKPAFNKKPWQQNMYDTLDAVDAILARYILVSNFAGVWNQATLYTAGQRVVDTVGGPIYTCNVTHTSTAVNTFAQDRIANPSFWTIFTFSVQFRGTWTAQTDFSTGDFVTFGQRLAVALAPHHSSASFLTDQANGLWNVLIDGTAVAALPSGVAGNADRLIRFDGPSLQYQLSPATALLSSAGVATFASLVIGNGGALTLGDATARANWQAALSLTPGTAANNIVQLDGTSKLPAVDGSALLNLPGPSAVRQCVAAGLVDSSGVAAHIAASGTALGVDLKASTTALVITWAGGFSTSGQADTTQKISVDALNYWAALPVSNTSFLAADYVSQVANPTAVQRLAPPQYGRTYDRTKQAVLQIAGAAGATTFLDDFGNTWTTVANARVQTNQIKFGTGALGGGGALNTLAAGDYIKNTGIIGAGTGSWTLRCWFYCTTAPGAGSNATIMALENVGRFGIEINLNNTAGVFKSQASLSSNGTSYDITAAITGTTVVTLNAWHLIELTFDQLAGVYRLYLDGVQDASVASALICSQNASGLFIGNNPPVGNQFLGYIDKPEFMPYCLHPAGTTYSVPVAAPDITVAGYASDWFDTVNYVMRQVIGVSGSAGVNPTFTTKNRVYIGEADTSGAAVTAVRPYAIEGRYVSPWVTPAPVAATAVSRNHNMGTDQINVKIELQNLVAEGGYLQGAIVGDPHTLNATYAYPFSPQRTRNTLTFTTGSGSPWGIVNASTGTDFGITNASWLYRVRAQRDF